MADAITETKRVINPRVEIDTSPPFESVKEAVNLFGGSGHWNSHPFLPLDADHNNSELFNVNRMEEQAARLERMLITREHETLNVLRELEEAKKLVEGLKGNLMQEGQDSTFISCPILKPENYLSAPTEKSAGMLSLSHAPPPGSILMNLDHARVNLNKTTIDLAVIRASVESLNKTMRKEKVLQERSSEAKVPNFAGAFSAEEYHRTSRATEEIDDKEEIKSVPVNSTSISYEHPQFNFEAEQFKKMVAASRYEVMKAMSEIERTKVSIKMAEMRLNAARKIEEAAKAVEAIAFADRKCLLNGENSSEAHLHKPEEITLSFEEYNALSHKAKQAEEMCKTKFVVANGISMDNEASQYSEAALRKLHQTTKETYKKNSLEAAFDNEGDVYKREVLEDGFHIERSEYDTMRDSGHSSAKSMFRNSHPSLDRNDSCLLTGGESNIVEDKTVPVYRSTISIGNILRRKLILQDDNILGKHVEAKAERRQGSLSQLLGEHSGLILHHTKSMKDGSVDKHCFAQKKKFGFIHVPLPIHKKKKTQVLNSS